MSGFEKATQKGGTVKVLLEMHHNKSQSSNNISKAEMDGS